ncbi:MAG: helix-turn-helix transcriptional regulator [Gammaproteobacteria bacterium]|nr:helix-turn-helix transcriptional regulator [Gammaproteobacteria bacterium]
MSAHTRTHHTEQSDTLYITYDDKHYAIPKKVADKYLINEEDEGSVSSEVIFAELNNRYTQAGALLKDVRAREDLTQVEFAKKIGVTQANLSAMENGKRPIGKIIAKRIEQIFKADYRYFLE